jgi:hypothetical protein
MFNNIQILILILESNLDITFISNYINLLIIIRNDKFYK